MGHKIKNDDGFRGYRQESNASSPAEEVNFVPLSIKVRNPEPRAFHQGQLDFFCAAYAVINALRMTHGIRLASARGILAETLKEISVYPTLWRSTLYNETDFFWLVEYMLSAYGFYGNSRLRVVRPHGSGFHVTPIEASANDLRLASVYRELNGKPFELDKSQVWEVLKSWLPHLPPEVTNEEELTSLPDFLPAPASTKKNRAVILRFHRYIPFTAEPIVSHWTTARAFRGDELLLFDATADPEAIHKIFYNDWAVRRGEIADGVSLHIELESLYLLERSMLVRPDI